MNIITLDFETFFSDTYTLKKMTTEAYIRDPQFQVHGVGIRLADGRKFWVPKERVHAAFAAINWTQTMVIAHHAQFDGLILAHHYGVKPAFWICTMSMARMARGLHTSVALGALARAYDFQEKTVPYDAMKGRLWENMEPELQQALGQGCLDDCDLTWGVWEKLKVGFPQEEMKLIDITVRMFTEPQLEGDVAALEKIKIEEWTAKANFLDELGVSKGDLQSSEKFIQLLESEGVDIEWKDGKNGPIPALAKTDTFMKGLVDNDDPRIASLATARLEVRSTIDETRAGRLAGMARRGKIPVYLNYWGAHTGRWSGGDKVNLQNLPRSSPLRFSLKAPEGYLLSVVDAAQIECRVLNTFAEQWDVVEAFRNGEDLYSKLASEFYGKPINKRDNPTERHLGKTIELGSGFQLGWEKLQLTCSRGALGGPPIKLSDDESEQAIRTYRGTHKQVVNLWNTAGRMIEVLSKDSDPIAWGCLTVQKDKITMPNGAILHYPNVTHYAADDTSQYDYWAYSTRNGRSKIYGGKLVENTVQAMARLATAQAMVRVHEAGIKIVTMSHDETVCVVPKSEAEAQHAFIMAQMKAKLPWLPDCPLDAEGHLTERYTK